MLFKVSLARRFKMTAARPPLLPSQALFYCFNSRLGVLKSVFSLIYKSFSFDFGYGSRCKLNPLFASTARFAFVLHYLIWWHQHSIHLRLDLQHPCCLFDSLTTIDIYYDVGDFVSHRFQRVSRFFLNICLYVSFWEKDLKISFSAVSSLNTIFACTIWRNGI